MSFLVCKLIRRKKKQGKRRKTSQRTRAPEGCNQKRRHRINCKYISLQLDVYESTGSMISNVSQFQMDELEISRCLAEKTLRENNGNIVDALKKLVEV